MIGGSRGLAMGRAIGLALAVALWVPPAAAQESADARVRRLEAEVRALQRQVFPGGSPRFFEGEIRPPAGAAPLPPPSTTAFGDVIARMDSLEAQLARLTAQIEENGNLARRLATRIAALENAGVALATAEPGAPGVAGPGPTDRDLSDRGLGDRGGLVPVGPPPVRPAPVPGGARAAIVPPARPANMAPGSVPSDRRVALRSIPRPATGDAGEDDYTYGFRLWQAGLFPEAAEQLQATVARHPRHAKVSYARNLLGRAYLDDNKPGTAAQVFLENYQANRAGARAPDSLLYLAVAMTRLNQTDRACVALQELTEGYPAEVAGRLGPEVQAARAAVTCDR